MEEGEKGDEKKKNMRSPCNPQTPIDSSLLHDKRHPFEGPGELFPSFTVRELHYRYIRESKLDGSQDQLDFLRN